MYFAIFKVFSNLKTWGRTWQCAPMIEFYRKVNKFFKKLAKCDPCHSPHMGVPPPGSVPRDRSCVGSIWRYSRTEINPDNSNSGSCNSTRMPSSYKLFLLYKVKNTKINTCQQFVNLILIVATNGSQSFKIKMSYHVYHIAAS